MKVKKNRVTFEITGIVDAEEAKRFLRQNGFEIVSESLDTPRSRTPHETVTGHTCPDCKGKGIVKDGFGVLYECERCHGSGQV